MTLFRSQLALGLLLLTTTVVFAAEVPITLDVDASEAPRRVLRARLTIPASPGTLTLHYPKWIPGTHGPTGPLSDVGRLSLTADGKALTWSRDDEEPYRIHCRVPDGARSVEASLDFLTPTAGRWNTITSRLAVLYWSWVLLYPESKPIGEQTIRASLRVPAEWKVGCALPIARQEGDTLHFKPVTLETLEDSPVLCGRFFREVQLGRDGTAVHSLLVACDSEAGLELNPRDRDALEKLFIESKALFGARHYNNYRFLLALSDRIAHSGREHHECSDNRLGEQALTGTDRRLLGLILAHELVHSWNGKYRRPAEMITPDFQKTPRTRLLWVYEGLTQYLGLVLAVRSGLWTPQMARDYLATAVEQLAGQGGRAWRPLDDTAAASGTFEHAARNWTSWRRSRDYYDEGALVWLEVDALIRHKTEGKKSLDDFCRSFFGGIDSGPSVKPFTFDELIAALNAVAPHDWKTLLERRVSAPLEEPPLDGLIAAGWTLGYTDQAPTGASLGGRRDPSLRSSIGLVVGADGEILDVTPGKAADRGGIGAGMKLIGVNMRRYTPALLQAAVTATKDGGKLELLLENGDFFRSVTLDYRDGARFARLERTSGPDLFEQILQPRQTGQPVKSSAP